MLRINLILIVVYVMTQSMVHGIPGGYGKGSVDDAREAVHGTTGNFKVGFVGGHNSDSGFGSRGQSGSFSSIEHGSTRNSHSDRIHFGSTKGSSDSDQGFGHKNINSNPEFAILGSNQNGINGGHKNWGQRTDEGVSNTFAHDRGSNISPAGNGFRTTGTSIHGDNLGRGNSDRNTGRHESDFNDFGSDVGGRGTSFGSSHRHGHVNGASFGGHDHSSEFGYAHSSGHSNGGHSNGGHSNGGHSHGFGIGSNSNVGDHVKGHHKGSHY